MTGSKQNSYSFFSHSSKEEEQRLQNSLTTWPPSVTHRLDTRLHALSYLCPLLPVLLKPEGQQLTSVLNSSDPALTLDAGEPNASEEIRGIHGSMADGIQVAASRLSACV
jgi:hypothetical protein